MNTAQLMNDAVEVIEQNALALREIHSVFEWGITSSDDKAAADNYQREMQLAADLREAALQYQDDGELDFS